VTCNLTEHAGGFCKTCRKILHPPEVLHWVRGDPQPDAHDTRTSVVDCYCDACCPVHQGKRPMTDRELVAWLRAITPGGFSGPNSAGVPGGFVRWKTLSGVEGCLDMENRKELYAAFDLLFRSAVESYRNKGGKELAFELILLLREVQ
jgi:hypothetical protein